MSVAADGLERWREISLKLIDDLRTRGARMVKLGGDGSIEAIFDGPPPAPSDLAGDPQAKHEHEQRRQAAKKPRSLDEKLLGPLGILKGTDAA